MTAPGRSSRPAASLGGAYAVSQDSVPHTYAFYTLPLGTWDATTTFDPAVHGRALDDPARPRR